MFYHTFYLRNYYDVYGLQNEFARLHIMGYNYGIGFIGYQNNAPYHLVIKYGSSNDGQCNKGYWGDRVIRQVDALPGWTRNRYRGAQAKKDFNNLLKTHFPNVNKNDIILSIWDYTDDFLGFSKAKKNKLLEKSESSLVSGYEKQNGVRPLGNIAKLSNEVANNNIRKFIDYGDDDE